MMEYSLGRVAHHKNKSEADTVKIGAPANILLHSPAVRRIATKVTVKPIKSVLDPKDQPIPENTMANKSLVVLSRALKLFRLITFNTPAATSRTFDFID